MIGDVTELFDDAAEYEQPDPREDEPECTCQRVDVDLYDTRGCELCDPHSDWNQECRAWDRAERPVVMASLSAIAAGDGELFSDDDTPF